MRRIRRASIVVALSLLALSPAFTSPARASFELECVVDGEAKVVDKSLPFGMLWVGGQGHFEMDGATLLCSGFAKGTPVEFSANTDWSGYYHNMVCGTTKFVGTVDNVYHTDNWKFVTTVLGDVFSIELYGGVGSFYWSVPNGSIDGKLRSDPKGYETNWEPAGAMQMLPPTSKFNLPDINECLKAMTLAGYFRLHPNL